MAVSPAALQRVVWIGLPAGLYFVVQTFGELERGAHWSAAAHAVTAALMLGSPILARGRVVNDRRGFSYAAVSALAVLAWLAGPTTGVQVAGFVSAVTALLALLLTARRSGVDAPPVRDDATIELDLNRRVG